MFESIAGPSGPEPDAELLRDHGITVVRADQYHVGGYRYTNLADAIAQADRQRRLGHSS